MAREIFEIFSEKLIKALPKIPEQEFDVPKKIEGAEIVKDRKKVEKRKVVIISTFRSNYGEISLDENKIKVSWKFGEKNGRVIKIPQIICERSGDYPEYIEKEILEKLGLREEVLVDLHIVKGPIPPWATIINDYEGDFTMTHNVGSVWHLKSEMAEMLKKYKKELREFDKSLGTQTPEN